MILRRFYDDGLAQASYLIACEKSKRALVVDPTVDTQIYIEAAQKDKVTISHVLETHVHADYLSGGAALAADTGAELGLSGEGASEWSYDFQSLPAARSLRNGEEISLGSVRVRVLHTPGHTPEHLTFLVIDESRGAAAVGALTGDFIFVGDVGRPDLLEKAVGAGGTTRASAAALFKSVQAFRSQPDHIQIWPGHGAGSACGKELGAMPSSTLGYEKLFNWAFTAKSEDEFVRTVLRDQPVPPKYFAEMKRRNRLARVAASRLEPAHLASDAIQAALNGGATVVDARPAATFAKGHITGTLNVPYTRSFLNWMGALVDYDRDLILIAGRTDRSPSKMLSDLGKIGLDRVTGWFDSSVLAAWEKSGHKLQRTSMLGVRELHDSGQSMGVTVIDVRAPHEWSEGHIPGATHIPLAMLPEKLDEIAAGELGPVAVHCAGGDRSAIAASLLQARGVANVLNISEGYTAWAAAGYTTEKGEAASH